MQQASTTGNTAVFSDQLLLAVAEELKLPLQQIARQAELSATAIKPITASLQADLQHIQQVADMATQLLDNYLFGARLALQQDYAASLEPVLISSVLYDTGQQLDSLAKLYGVKLELQTHGRCAPVLTNRQGLQAALASLGYTLITALPSITDQPLRLRLAAHNSRYGVVAGLYTDVEQLTREALRQGRTLYGHVRQPIATLSHSSGAGVFVADAILQNMSNRLMPSRHGNLYGLGTVLQTTPQLQLV